MRAERSGEVAALHNDDTFHGTFVAGQFRGEKRVPLMNSMYGRKVADKVLGDSGDRRSLSSR